jgi:hypothetical protein
MIETFAFGMQVISIAYVCYWAFKSDSQGKH